VGRDDIAMGLLDGRMLGMRFEIIEHASRPALERRCVH
jgi:hypothetical protein